MSRLTTAKPPSHPRPAQCNRWEHWSAYQCVGDLFMSLVQHHGQLFRDYYEAYDRQMSTLRAVREQNPPVRLPW